MQEKVKEFSQKEQGRKEREMREGRHHVNKKKATNSYYF